MTSPEAEAEPCVAEYHAWPAVPSAEKIRWHAQTGADAARVSAWTCSAHADTVYELCELGAAWFLRRRKPMGVDETVRVSRKVTEALWHRLLAGAAR